MDIDTAKQDRHESTKVVMPMVNAEIERDRDCSVSPTRLEAIVDGKVFTARVDHAKGSRERPFSITDTREKLQSSLLYGGFDPEGANAFDEIVSNIETSRDVAADFARLSRVVRK